MAFNHKRADFWLRNFGFKKDHFSASLKFLNFSFIFYCYEINRILYFHCNWAES